MRRYQALRRASEIAALKRRGVRLAGSALHGYGDHVGPSNAVAVAVAKAVGGAVVRNRIRRRVRGALEQTPPPPRTVRLFFIARPQAAEATYAAIAADVQSMLAQLERKAGRAAAPAR
jgi:ribonuclease P protein component